MERYLVQLAEDLRDAAAKVPDPDELLKAAGIKLPQEFKEFADVELYLYGPLQKLSVILGIEKTALPPVEQITDSQITFLYDEMVRLLKAYHFVPDFPEGLTVKLKYYLLREKWESKQVNVGTGTTHLEFCNYEPEKCLFPQEYCQCKDLFEGEDVSNNIGD